MVVFSNCKQQKQWIGYKDRTNLILTFWRCLTHQKVSGIKFAEVEKNPKMNTTKLNYNYISTEQSLSVNVLLWVILAVPSDIFNKMEM